MISAQPMKQEVDFGLHVGDTHDMLCNAFHRRAFWRHLNPSGPQQKLLGQMLDTLRECCAEQQVLPLSRNDFQDVSQLWHEPHVHHPVGLVQHHAVQFFGDECAPQIQFHEAPGGGNHHIDAAFQRFDL